MQKVKEVCRKEKKIKKKRRRKKKRVSTPRSDTLTSTFSAFYCSISDKYIHIAVNSCTDLKIPHAGLVITSSVVLVVSADLFKHKMNSPGLIRPCAGTPRGSSLSDMQQHHENALKQPLSPNAHSCPRPAQPHLWLCSEFTFFFSFFLSFAREENGVFFHWTRSPVQQTTELPTKLCCHRAKGNV